MVPIYFAIDFEEDSCKEDSCPCGHQCVPMKGRSKYGFGIDCYSGPWYAMEDCKHCSGHGQYNSSKSEYICMDGYASTKCLNGGTLVRINTDDLRYGAESADPFFCDCPPFYVGDRCETYFCINEKDCSNGGVCSEEDRWCDCPDGYSGMQCEFENSSSV